MVTVTSKATKIKGKAEAMPVAGVAKWIEPMKDGFGWIRITTTTKAGTVAREYEVAEVYTKGGMIECYRLFSEAGAYDVDPDAGTCTCPDAQMRRGGRGCKHAMALRAALARLFQPVTLATVIQKENA